MNNKTRKWLHGLLATIISGGASAVVSGFLSMGFAPDKFNLTSMNGLGRLMGLTGANFLVSGLLSAFFYLKQSPLPPDDDTQFVSRPISTTEPPKTP